MAIIDVKGRPRSIRTKDEEWDLICEDIERLPKAERIALMELWEKIQLEGEEPFNEIAEADYEYAPIGVEEFINEPYFLGETGSALWPALKKDLIELFSGGYHEAILGGSIGWGKSYFATTALAYIIYLMSCLRSPQRAYGISPGSYIYVAMLSVTEKVARRVSINELIGKVSHSRYFKERFKPKIAPSTLEMRFPKDIMVVGGSTGSSAIIGLNAFAGFIDESSYMGGAKEVDRSGRLVVTDKGETIYKSIVRRMKSRFQKVGRLPGMMITASSKERPVAFVEKRIDLARQSMDPGCFVREYATWDVKDKEDFSDKTFKVAAGNERIRSRIITSDAEEERFRDLELQIVEVPEDYRVDFEDDLDGALRDIAGIATMSVSPYMQRTEKVHGAAQYALVSPIGDGDNESREEWVAGTPLVIYWNRICKSIDRRLPGGFIEQAWRPMRHPDAIRYVHIDSSLTGDCTGVTIAHVASWTEVVRKDPIGDEYNELAPIIETDFMLRVIPPPGDEILLSDVRAIVYMFMEHGFNIGFVSQDQYQSADSLQQFRKRGIEAELLSVDRTPEPYEVLKACMYEDRLRMHDLPWVQRELTQLQRVPRKSGIGYKIDHPAMGIDGMPGSKDIADSLAGVVHSLTQRSPGMPIPPQMSMGMGQAESRDDSWVTGGRTMIAQESGSKSGQGSIVGKRSGREMPPFIKG